MVIGIRLRLATGTPWNLAICVWVEWLEISTVCTLIRSRYSNTSTTSLFISSWSCLRTGAARLDMMIVTTLLFRELSFMQTKTTSRVCWLWSKAQMERPMMEVNFLLWFIHEFCFWFLLVTWYTIFLNVFAGYFQFYVRCPPDYPISNPRVRLLTTGDNTVRFNPNLYANGKVCLSLLG